MNLKYVQFAKDYNFKEALILYPSKNNYNIKVEEFLKSGKFARLSIEYFFETSQGLLIFGSTQKGGDYSTFAKEGISSFKNIDGIVDVMNDVEVELPSEIRIGVIDYWFETGPCIVWKRGQDTNITNNTLLYKLGKYQRVKKSKLNSQGLSFYFSSKDFGIEHWIMYEVSIKTNFHWELDIIRILDLIKQRI